ncbi:hypothetical protein EDD68_13122 [Melghiribacillus thermohalophilus]|uniref:ABC-2 type transport system permease protein n=1 Tax=Melghiribacillus thermohalophilus TaxID=1324956 RepID=A0A4R3MPQ2_9BACI|nr:hypothetical protein [Melghiribacillus thermohalophilus]TCT17503.1 hypothetical protein EDD68_13122 [Melghiribacillus thermohalophilus]
MKKKLEKIYILFKFDFKTSGFLFFLPLVMWMVSIFQLMIQHSQQANDIYNSIIVFQGIYIPFAGWGLMYRLKEMYEDGASDTLKPYYRSNLIFDINRYLSIHLMGTIIWCLFFSMKYNISIIWPIHMIHFFLITLLFMFLGTALVVTIKNIEFSLTIFFIYLIIEFATLGEYMPWPHVFIFQNAVWDTQLKIKFISISTYIIILFCTTLIFINRDSGKAID